MNSRYLLPLVSLLLLFGVAAAADQKVGLMIPLTGDFGYFGAEVKKGFEIAEEQAKASGQTVPEVFIEDEQCLARPSVSAINNLINVKKISMMIGPACSTSIYSVAPIAAKNSLKTIFLLDAGQRVAKMADPLYSLGFDPEQMARSLAGDAVKRKLLKVGIIAEEEEYAGLVSKAFEAEFRRQGGEVTLAENVPVNSDSLRTVLTKVLSQKVDFIFFSSAYQAGTFLKQLRVLNENVPVYGNDTMCVSDTIDAAGAAAERVRCANVLLDESKAMAANFRKALEKKYGAAPTSLFYASLGHDAFYLMQQELRNGESAGKLLLGAGRRGEDGIYYVEPKVLEIRSGKMLPVESLK